MYHPAVEITEDLDFDVARADAFQQHVIVAANSRRVRRLPAHWESPRSDHAHAPCRRRRRLLFTAAEPNAGRCPDEDVGSTVQCRMRPAVVRLTRAARALAWASSPSSFIAVGGGPIELKLVSM